VIWPLRISTTLDNSAKVHRLSRRGVRPAGLASYTRSLELDPKNENARQRIAKLR